MSDNEDLLGDDLGDQSLADYNLGNEEEEQLLADDYENTGTQNVPSSLGPPYRDPVDNMVPQPQEYTVHEYGNQPLSYQHPPVLDTECVVPNITVEVPNTIRQHATYAPYEPPVYDEHAVPPAIPAAPIESPQIVPSDIMAPVSNGSVGGICEMVPRDRFISERPPGAQRMPQVRDIPDSLDKVVIPRGASVMWPRGAGRTWRSANYTPRHAAYSHPYRRNNMHRNNFIPRSSFPPPQIRSSPPQIRPEIRSQIRPEVPPDMRSDIHPDMRPELRPDLRPEMHADMHPEMRPDMRLEMRPDMRPEMRPDMHPEMRPDMHAEMRPDMRAEMRPDMRADMRPDMRPEMRLDMRSEMGPDMRPEMRPNMPPEMRSNMPPEIRPESQSERPELRRVDIPVEPRLPSQMGPEISPERPILPQEMPMFRPPIERPPYFPRFQFRANIEERPPFGNRPNYDPRFFRPNFAPRQFPPPPIRELPPNAPHMQVTIRQTLPGMPAPGLDKMGSKGDLQREPEVRMLPVALPANLPPGGLAGKKVLINPHFKGNFQPPIDGLPVYIPTRIQKSPPLLTPIENKLGPVTDIDDAAERFIAEQRNALARAAVRKQVRRSPQRYIENTTIEIANDLAPSPYCRNDDDDLLRRQEEFINANRAGLRRRMRSPTPPRRSPSPRRSPERRSRSDDDRHYDEDSEYKRRLREQENLRERVLRAKEVRRRKNAVALHKQLQEKEREMQDKSVPKALTPPETIDKPTSTELDNKPDTTRTSPEKEKVKPTPPIVRDRSPVKEPQVNSTVENLTPPHRLPIKQESPERALTPPLPEKKEEKKLDSDDDLDLILGDIDGILSDDDDSGRFKDKAKKAESHPPKSKPQVDLRSKLPPRATSTSDKKPQRQKIIFNEGKDDKKKKDKSPPRRAIVSSTKPDDNDVASENKKSKTKPKTDNVTIKSRQRIIYNKEVEKESDDKKSSFTNRRVILQRNTLKDKPGFSRIEVKSDPSKPNPGIFSRAVRTAIGGDNRIVIKKDEPQIQYESDSEIEEENLLEESGNIAAVTNLPHGMTDTRLKTLAGNDVQSLILDREDRTAKITFKTTIAAETFKKKFNNKMVAASRLTVTLR